MKENIIYNINENYWLQSKALAKQINHYLANIGYGQDKNTNADIDFRIYRNSKKRVYFIIPEQTTYNIGLKNLDDIQAAGDVASTSSVGTAGTASTVSSYPSTVGTVFSTGTIGSFGSI